MKAHYYWSWWTVVCVLVLRAQPTTSQKDKAEFCTVCRVLVNEINGRISAVDPNKKIQVGSYRMDSDGNQNLAEVGYATSDLHLTEVFEDVCQAFKDRGMMQSNCDELMDDHEDDMMTIFKQDDPQAIEAQLCVEVSGACTEEDLEEPVPELPRKPGLGKYGSVHLSQYQDGVGRPVEGANSMEDIRDQILAAAGVGGNSDDGDCDAKDEL